MGWNWIHPQSQTCSKSTSFSIEILSDFDFYFMIQSPSSLATCTKPWRFRSRASIRNLWLYFAKLTAAVSRLRWKTFKSPLQTFLEASKEHLQLLLRVPLSSPIYQAFLTFCHSSDAWSFRISNTHSFSRFDRWKDSERSFGSPVLHASVERENSGFICSVRCHCECGKLDNWVSVSRIDFEYYDRSSMQ